MSPILPFSLSNNDTSAKIDGSGTVTAGERGEAFLMARFYTYTIGVPFIVLPKGFNVHLARRAGEQLHVDTLVNEKLKKLRITPSEICSDEVYIRRVYLDIIGLLPTEEEYARYMVSSLAQQTGTAR